MKRLDGIILEGEKIGVERATGKNNLNITRLHLLNGFESTSLKVNDANLIKQLEEYPVRKALKIKASVSMYKDEFYLTATSIVN